MTNRKIICADTNQWIKNSSDFDSVVTSLPDSDETNMTVEEWERWFEGMVRTIVEKTKHYAIFYQTDRKSEGRWISKSFLTQKGAYAAGAKLLWHKIVLRREAGAVDLFRPGYTHLLCFSKHDRPGKATADVIEGGAMIYKNAMGLNACRVSMDFIKNNGDSRVITDPFCGKGSIPAVANKMGFDSVGVEILPDYAEESRSLTFK